MRGKEEANDYRYFPDPDLLPLIIDDATIDKIRRQLPELPWQRRERFQTAFGLSHYDAHCLSVAREMADFFEATVNATSATPKIVANWVLGDFSALLNKEQKELAQSPISPQQLGQLLNRIADNTISGKIAKTVFEAMWAGEGEGEADQIIAAQGLTQITDNSAIEAIIDEILAKNPTQLEQYRAGAEKLFGFFVGQAMKATEGKANPQQVNEVLKQKLKNG
jgi:aspartyl-tRNA(Asn)/glutamyl-tRNA(Gln) amidotransferase subunit B